MALVWRFGKWMRSAQATQETMRFASNATCSMFPFSVYLFLVAPGTSQTDGGRAACAATCEGCWTFPSTAWPLEHFIASCSLVQSFLSFTCFPTHVDSKKWKSTLRWNTILKFRKVAHMDTGYMSRHRAVQFKQFESIWYTLNIFDFRSLKHLVGIRCEFLVYCSKGFMYLSCQCHNWSVPQRLHLTVSGFL